MNFRKMKRNFRRNTKAISPVIATLLMIAIAVVAALVTYAWVMGYMNFTTGKIGNTIQIQSVSVSGTTLTAYVQNVGDSDVIAIAGQGLYYNGLLIGGPAGTSGNDVPLTKGSTIAFTGTIAAPIAGNQYTVKATTKDGSISEFPWTAP